MWSRSMARPARARARGAAPGRPSGLAAAGYRRHVPGVTLAAIRAGIDLADEAALGALAERVSVRLPPGRVLLDGEDVTGSSAPSRSPGASRLFRR